jgi:hypothetical protein
MSQWRAYLAVMCYLVVFGCQHMEPARVEKMIRTMDAVKACRFYNFMLDSHHLNGWIRDQWSTLYDADFVMAHLFEPTRAISRTIQGRAPGKLC